MKRKVLYVLLLVILLLVALYGPATVQYLEICAVEGDHLNDWLTHLPKPMVIVGGTVVLVKDASEGRVGIDTPWEDYYPTWLADLCYEMCKK